MKLNKLKRLIPNIEKVLFFLIYMIKIFLTDWINQGMKRSNLIGSLKKIELK